MAAITAVKSAIVALAVDAAANSHQPRFSGKAMKVRALGYIGGGLLLVPQFTLLADTASGTRPGFSAAGPPGQARALFEGAPTPVSNDDLKGLHLSVTAE